MKKLLKSGWMTMVIGSIAYLCTTMALLMSVADQVLAVPDSNPSDEKASRLPIDLASWNYINPDIDELSRQLKSKQDQLDQREKDLEKVAEQIANEKRELAGVTNWVHSIQSEIDMLFTRVEDEEAANMKEIVTVYQQMDPKDSAKMLYELDDRRVAKIFKFLKQSEVTAILKVWLSEDDRKLKRALNILDLYHNIILPSSA